MLKQLLLAIFLLSGSLFAGQITKEMLVDAQYIVSLDGGGTKTALQVLDRSGRPLNLKSGQAKGQILSGPSSNINTVREEGFDRMLSELFDHLYCDGVPFAQIQAQTIVVGGFAGLAGSINEGLVRGCFAKRGFSPNQLLLLSDAKMAAELIEGQGVVLIAGTGSIAFGVDGQREYRAGGLGRMIGDEGSGYFIGIQAIKSALEEEFGYGTPTALTERIRQHYQVAQVRELIGKIHGGALSPGQIAEIALEVLDFARQNDPVAQTIVQQAASELGKLVVQVLKQMDLAGSVTIYLVGGLFKSDDQFALSVAHSEELAHYLADRALKLAFRDVSRESATTLVIQKVL